MDINYIIADKTHISLIKKLIYDYWLEIELEKIQNQTPNIYPDESVQKLIQSTILHTYKFFSDPNYRIEDDMIYLITFKNRIIGLVSFGIYENFSELFIYDLCIIKEFQGRGYGKNTLKFAEEIANQNKLNKLGLWVDNDNVKAYNLYNNFGFEFFEDRIFDWFNSKGKVTKQTISKYLVKNL
jgi:ribosomal protein S18 acetylase RimI-like enzyme